MELSVNPYDNPMEQVLFYRWSSRGTERLGNLPRVHTASRWQSQDSNSKVLAPESNCCVCVCVCECVWKYTEHKIHHSSHFKVYNSVAFSTLIESVLLMKHYVAKIIYVIWLSLKKNKIMPLAATWMDLEIITLSEISQRKTNVWHHLCKGSKTMIQMNLFIKLK